MEKAKNKFKKLTALIQDLENNFDAFEVSNELVSKNNVAWHLDHSMKVIIEIVKYVDSSDVAAYKRQFNMKRNLVFLMGAMPRGKGKAPKIVQALDTVLLSDLQNQLQLVQLSLQKLDTFHDNKNFKHPLFGLLNVQQTVKFLEIHTYHHLKIVRDIKK